MPNAYVDESNPQRECAYWGGNCLIIPLKYLIIATVYSEPAICQFYCVKNTDILKLNEYTYLTEMLLIIQIIWELSLENANTDL